MRLPAATWPAGDSALNLAPGQAALSSANRRAPRLGGCNNHLKGQIKAPLREFLCSRPQLMLRGLFKPRRGRCFKYLPPESNPPHHHPRLRAGGGRGAHGQGPLLGGVAGTEQLRRGPDRSPPPPRRPGQAPKGPR